MDTVYRHGERGRFAFRYFVSWASTNGDYIGLDTVTVETAAVPEPSTVVMLLLTIAGPGWLTGRFADGRIKPPMTHI
jgi:hypothetical protein